MGGTGVLGRDTVGSIMNQPHDVNSVFTTKFVGENWVGQGFTAVGSGSRIRNILTRTGRNKHMGTRREGREEIQ